MKNSRRLVSGNFFHVFLAVILSIGGLLTPGNASIVQAAAEPIWIEAETGSLTSPMRIGSDSAASQGQFIDVPNGAGSGGEAVYTFQVPAAGTYTFWGRVQFINSNDDSFFLSIDGGADEYYWAAAASGWQWRKHPGNTFTLSAGTHSLVVREREDGARLDKMLLTPDPAYTPSGMGGVPRAPFLGQPFTPPTVIEAEQFDLGGEGIAYHDTTPQNEKNEYRKTEGVDIGVNETGYQVGVTKAGEWLEYSIRAETAGTYGLKLKYASQVNGTVHLEMDGVNVTGPISTYTGGWLTWAYTNEKTFELSEGDHRLRLVMDKEVSGSVGNFDHMLLYKTPLFEPSDDVTAPSVPDGLTVDVGNGIAYASWNPNSESDLAGYYVYVNGVQQSPFYQKTATYTISGLKFGETFNVQVQAVDIHGNLSAKSPESQIRSLPYIDVTKAPYFAKGDGISDDTAALQKALSDNTGKNALVFIPNGTYVISDTLTWSNYVKTAKRMMVQGESREGTVIRLKNQAPGFGNLAMPKAVVSSYSGPGGVAGSASNDEINYQAFMNSLADITIDTGSGNSGAIGVEWINHNQGGLQNVTIRSGDVSGAGVVGLDITKPWIGPGYIRNVSIHGFDIGVKTRNTTYSMVFEHLELKDQKVVGIDTSDYILSIRDLRSENTVPVLQQHDSELGMVSIVDGQFIGGSSANAAIVNDNGQLFVRNINASGYGAVLRDRGELTAGNAIGEYVSGGVYTLFPSPLQSLGLVIEEAPAVGLSSPKAIVANGVNAMDFKLPADPDDTLAIQRAIDSGAEIVYFPTRSIMTISDTIHVRGNVKQITAFESTFDVSNVNNFATKPVFRFEGTQASVMIERFATQRKNSTVHLWFENASPYNVILRNAFFTDGKAYMNSVPGGRVFIEDVAGTSWTFNNQSVWARQLNPESGSVKITNNGGNLWILGLKTEKKGTNVANYNGGFAEVIGGLIYPASGNGVMDQPAFINHESSMSVIIGEEKGTSTSQGHYIDWVAETRNGETRILKDMMLPRRSVGTMIPLYVGIRDTTPPVTTSELVGTQVNGWYKSDVVVKLTAADDSGTVAGTVYSTDNGGTWLAYNGPILVNEDGNHSIQFGSYDVAGNTEVVKSVQFAIDKTPPELELVLDGVQRISPITLDAETGRQAVVSVIASDFSGSGVKSVEGVFNQASLDFTRSLDFMQHPGANTLTVTASDRSGNVSVKQYAINVTVSVDAISAYLDQLERAGELGNAVATQLKQNLKQVEHHQAKGDIDKAAREWEKFLSRLNEKQPSANAAPHHVSDSAKAVLNKLASYMLGAL